MCSWITVEQLFLRVVKMGLTRWWYSSRDMQDVLSPLLLNYVIASITLSWGGISFCWATVDLQLKLQLHHQGRRNRAPLDLLPFHIAAWLLAGEILVQGLGGVSWSKSSCGAAGTRHNPTTPKQELRYHKAEQYRLIESTIVTSQPAKSTIFLLFINQFTLPASVVYLFITGPHHRCRRKLVTLAGIVSFTPQSQPKLSVLARS